MESPLDKQMAGIKDKADLLRFVGNLSEDIEGVLLVKNPETARVSVRHMGPITLPRALWYAEVYKQWLISQ
jgi:hypothetical protein